MRPLRFVLGIALLLVPALYARAEGPIAIGR